MMATRLPPVDPDAPSTCWFSTTRFFERQPLQERRAALRRLIPRSPKSHLQFSEDIAGDGDNVFASAEQLGLESIVSKQLGSHDRSRRADNLV
jgi:ATP-dependent DNA ligase